MCRSWAKGSSKPHDRSVHSSALFKLGMALLVLTLAGLTALAAGTGHPLDAVVIGLLGAVVIAAVLGGKRFLSQWVRRRDVE